MYSISSKSSLRHQLVVYSDWCLPNATAQEAIVKLLLEEGADVNELAGCPAYPLYTAAAHCSEEVVQLIIDKGAVLDKFTSKGKTALKAAADRETRAATIMKILSQAGVVMPKSRASRNPVLNSALAFFGGEVSEYRHSSGSFILSSSIEDVLEGGPGAVVKLLMPRLPREKADKKQYELLLQMAIVVEDYECVKLLLQRKVDVNAAGYYYGSALQAAARVGSVEFVQILLGVGANINLLQGEHRTALWAAVLGMHEEVVNILIKYGADVNLPFVKIKHYSKDSKSVLYLSLETGNGAIVKSLLAAGADFNVDSSNHPSVLITACGSGDVTLIQLLLDSGAVVDGNGKRWGHVPDEKASALHMVSAKGHQPVARLLLQHGAEIEKEDETSRNPLQVAAHAGHVPLVRLLIKAGAKVDRNNSCGTALSVASGNGHLEVVQELINAGASIVDPSRVANALAVACQGRRHSIIEFLLEELSGTDKEESTCSDALSAAFFSHDDEILLFLLEHRVSVSPSLLSQAYAAGLLGSVCMLLEYGVDINSDDGEGGHALHAATCHQRSHVVQLLVDHGADVHLESAKYGSPLLAALEGCMAPKFRSWARAEPAKSLAKTLPLPAPLFDFYSRFYRTSGSRLGYKDFAECERIVRILVDHGVEINTSPGRFGNALHLASFVGSEVIVRLLLDKGANVNATGGYFEIALLSALEGNQPPSHS